jgi:hypothetical protein
MVKKLCAPSKIDNFRDCFGISNNMPVIKVKSAYQIFKGVNVLHSEDGRFIDDCRCSVLVFGWNHVTNDPRVTF